MPLVDAAYEGFGQTLPGARASIGQRRARQQPAASRRSTKFSCDQPPIFGSKKQSPGAVQTTGVQPNAESPGSDAVQSGARRLIFQIARPFAKPWKLEEQDESLQIRDAAGRILANVYFEDEPTRRNFSTRLSKDDARRMAQQILRLPELVRIAKGIDPSEA